MDWIRDHLWETWLGLSIVHGVVKEHDGFVDVVSEVGRGTEFTLYFHRSHEQAQRRDSRPAVVRGSACILVVDDDPVQLRTARRVLSRLGYDVVTTRSGVQARALCAGERARRFRNVARPRIERAGIGDVHDQRMIRRAALEREDAAYRIGTRGVGGEAVHRFGRQSDRLAATQRRDGDRDVRIVRVHAATYSARNRP